VRGRKGFNEQTNEYETFSDFMRKLISVPHSEVKAKLDAEKMAKKPLATA